jgi:biotin carboxyl carrier protein
MDSKDYKVRVNDSFEFESLSLDDFDVVPIGHNKFHILRNNQSYHGEVVSADFARKLVSLRINGTTYQVSLSDPLDQLVRELGLTAVSAQVVKEIKAPMPGLVLDIHIQEGDTVEQGNALLILEAMKMENVIKSPGKGIVKAVHVKKGQPVEKNQLLLEME